MFLRHVDVYPKHWGADVDCSCMRITAFEHCIVRILLDLNFFAMSRLWEFILTRFRTPSI